MVQRFCCICRAAYRDNIRGSVSLHRFPSDMKDPVNRQKWVKACGVRLLDAERMVVCSKHFRKEDLAGCAGKRWKVKPGATPSIDVPHPIPDTEPETYQSSIDTDDQLQSDEVITGDLDHVSSCDEASTSGIDEKDPLQIDEMESLPIPDVALKGEVGEDTLSCRSTEMETCIILSAEAKQCKVKEEVCQMDESEASSTTETNLNQEDDELQILSSHSSAEPQYALEIMTTRLQISQQDLKNVTKSLEEKTREVKALQSSHKSHMAMIVHLRKRIQDLEQQQSVWEQRVPPQHSIPTQDLQDTAYNLVRAECELRSLEIEKAMPHHWSFTVTSGGILLFYANNVGVSVWPVSRCITVQPDMTLDIQIMGFPPPKLDLGQMKCLMDILCAMKTVSSLRACIGFDGKCSSKGYLEVGAHSGEKRCLECRKEYAQLQTSRHEKKPFVIAGNSKEARELISAKQKVQCLRKRLDLAEDEIIKLKHENIKLKKQRIEMEATTGKALNSISSAQHFLSSV